MTYFAKPASPGELMHFGVKGMRWGVRKDSKLRPSNWMKPNEIESIGWDRMIAAERKLRRHSSYDSPGYKKDAANYDKVKAEVEAERAAARAKAKAAKQKPPPARVERPARQPYLPNDSSREEALVARSLNQAYERKVAPAMNHYVANIPPHNQSSDPAVNALLNRALSQGLDRVEAQAGQGFGAGLPGRYRQM